MVPHTDEYQNEYLPPHAERPAWLTGFTGSAGELLVGADAALLVTDGRYAEQAPTQVAESGTEVAIAGTDRRSLVVDRLRGSDRVGLEAGSVTWSEQRRLADWFDGSGLVATEGLVEELRQVKDEGEVAAKVRARARGFEWVVLGWIWAVWAIHVLEWVDLGWAYYPVMVSQTLLTVFVVLEHVHRRRLGRLSISGESLLARLRSVGAVLTEAEIDSAQSSSDELMQRFGLLTATLTVGLLATLLWTGADLASGLLREAAVRLVTLEGAILLASLVAMWKRGR